MGCFHGAVCICILLDNFSSRRSFVGLQPPQDDSFALTFHLSLFTSNFSCPPPALRATPASGDKVAPHADPSSACSLLRMTASLSLFTFHFSHPPPALRATPASGGYPTHPYKTLSLLCFLPLLLYLFLTDVKSTSGIHDIVWPPTNQEKIVLSA